MIIIGIVAVILIISGIIILFYLGKMQKSFGILSGKRIYQDTQKSPGFTIYSKTLPLCGKPDYLLKKGNIIIPVEFKNVKTTPATPYLNHTIQLMAYCLLVEEHFKIRPPGGYIKYPHKEFKIEYTKEAEESVRSLVKEILHYKKSNEEMHCPYPKHNL